MACPLGVRIKRVPLYQTGSCEEVKSERRRPNKNSVLAVYLDVVVHKDKIKDKRVNLLP